MRKTYRIPLVDVKAQYIAMKKEIDSAITGVLQSGVYILGTHVVQFEQEFAEYLNAKYAVGVACGTDAICIALKSLGIGKGDEVIIPVNSYPTIFGVVASGAHPRLVDVSSQTYTINPLLVEKAITKKTKAIIPVHLYGLVADMDAIYSIARRHNIFIIEDAAQAHGAAYQGKKVGSLGDIACFSFYPTKNLGCFGDGGAITTRHQQLAERAQMLRMYGERKRYDSRKIGNNSRLDEIHAAVLRARLPHLDANNAKRRSIALTYRKLLGNTSIILPQETGSEHVYHLFVVRTSKRYTLRASLDREGIETGIHYPTPLHLVPSFKNLQYKRGEFPIAEELAEEIVSLPCYPGLSGRAIESVCKVVKNVLK